MNGLVCQAPLAYRAPGRQVRAPLLSNSVAVLLDRNAARPLPVRPLPSGRPHRSCCERERPQGRSARDDQPDLVLARALDASVQGQRAGVGKGKSLSPSSTDIQHGRTAS